MEWLEKTSNQMARSACGCRWLHYLEDAVSEARISGFAALKQGKPLEMAAVACRRGARHFLKRLAGGNFQRASLVETMPLDGLNYSLGVLDPNLLHVESDIGFNAIIAILPDARHRRMITAWIDEGVSQQVIAKRESISQGEASKTIRDGLNILRLHLEADPELLEAFHIRLSAVEGAS